MMKLASDFYFNFTGMQILFGSWSKFVKMPEIGEMYNI